MIKGRISISKENVLLFVEVFVMVVTCVVVFTNVQQYGAVYGGFNHKAICRDVDVVLKVEVESDDGLNYNPVHSVVMSFHKEDRKLILVPGSTSVLEIKLSTREGFEDYGINFDYIDGQAIIYNDDTTTIDNVKDNFLGRTYKDVN